MHILTTVLTHVLTGLVLILHYRCLLELVALLLQVIKGETLVAGKGGNQFQGVSGLVHRDHMACFEDSDEGQRTQTANCPRRLTIGSRTGVGRPILGSHSRPLVRAIPLELIDPTLIPHPVADEIQIAGVDHDADAILHHLGNDAVEVAEPVTRKISVNVETALLPLTVHAQGGLDIGAVHEICQLSHVVAKGTVALLSNVVHINSRVRIKDALECRELADVKGNVARKEPLSRVAKISTEATEWIPEINAITKRLAENAVSISKVSICAELDSSIGQTIANCKTLEIQIKAF
mmetsp:Transcript_31834/g.57871  ORF Transcript_31834/g.57871 Transcript_31834/m.57871 type:complete len:293 (-) Transcript_31834:708-1586(-)